MLNFSAIRKKGVLGKVLRLPLRLVPLDKEVPILQGRLRGKKWVTGSGDNHGYWLGSYELDMQKSFSSMIHKGDVLYDIGANAGFFTLLASELVGPAGRVFSFEPLPENVAYLKRHIDINHCNNVVVFEAAVSDKNGIDFLGKETSNAEWSILPGGTIKVKTLTLDDFCLKEKNAVPTHIKIDVEGNELAVLYGARRVLSDSSPVIFLETHGQQLHKQCCAFLNGIRYGIFSLDKRKSPEETHAIVAYKEK